MIITLLNQIKILNQKRGFTVIEAVVAQLMLTIGALSIWSLFVVGSRINAEAEDRTIATNIAQQKMEEIMNTRFRYIVDTHPPGETLFEYEVHEEPYWTRNSEGEMIPSLPNGKYITNYPDGLDADPLRILVTVSWKSSYKRDNMESSVDLETLVSMTPGRFR